MSLRVPPYFNFLIPAFERGDVGRFVHLGHWESAVDPICLQSPDDFAAAQSRLNDRLLHLLKVRDGQTVLDVGCGFGGTLEVIDQHNRHLKLTGVNIDPRQLDICRRLAPTVSNEYSWIEADACELNLDDAMFDRVISVEAMFHFLSRQQFFCEVARVLRPPGVFVASDICLTQSALHLPDIGLIRTLICREYGPWPEFDRPDADYAGLARNAGLSLVKKIDATHFTRLSHCFTVPDHVNNPEAECDDATRAAMMLRRLHWSGHLRYVYLELEKA